MISLIQNELIYDYDIRAIINAFYQNTKIIDKLSDKSIFTMKVNFDKVIVIEIIDNEKYLKKSIECEDFRNKVNFKNDIKQLVYKILSEYTNKKLPWGTLTGIRPTKIAVEFLEKGKDSKFIKDYFMNTYLTTEQKADISIAVANKELNILKPLDYKNGYSLYIGIPFCPSTCLYCSFTSYPIFKYKDKIDSYLEALFKEIEFIAHRYKNKKLNTVYIGGGTPTSLSADCLNRLLKKIKESFDFSNCLEFTVEAGRPDSITIEKLEVLKKNNVDRISINPQTMNDETLKLIGRAHNVKQTLEAFKLAREIGFDNINMDIITGLPNEEIKELENTLNQISELKPESLTVHSLAIKRSANLNIYMEKYKSMVKSSTNEMLELVDKYAKQLKLEPYYLYRQKNISGNLENIGYSKIDKECLYNILIMEEKQTIIALGAGASSKYVYSNENRIERVENVKDVNNYISRIDEMIHRKRNIDF